MGELVGISKKQIEKVFDLLTSKSDEVLQLIEASFLEEKFKKNIPRPIKHVLINSNGNDGMIIFSCKTGSKSIKNTFKIMYI